MDTVNRFLRTYADAAHAAYDDSQLSGQCLPSAQMKAEILCRYQELGEQKAGLLPIPIPPFFKDHYPPVARRAGPAHEPAHRPQRLSKTYLDSLANSLAVLLDFATATDYELTLAGMTPTYGKHIRALKNFLGWAKDNDLAVGHKFEAPYKDTGTDALTQRELLAIAELDFYTERARTLVRQHFEALDTPEAPRRRGQHRTQVDEYRILERLRTLEQARDKFLQRAYLALRISHANKLAPRHLDYERHVVHIKAGKTQLPCVSLFLDDVFKPVALIEKYRPLGSTPTC